MEMNSDIILFACPISLITPRKFCCIEWDLARLTFNFLSNESVVDLFQQFGPIKIFRRPRNSNNKFLCPYAMISYEAEDMAARAIVTLDGTTLEGLDIRVQWAEQFSFFTGDTGFITNYNIETERRNDYEFDSSMPPDHREKKRLESLKNADSIYTVRVDNLQPTTTENDIRQAFSRFGEISSIEYPVDKKTRKFKGFAFVRYLQRDAAEQAVDALDSKFIDQSDSLRVAFISTRSYFSQDETWLH